MLVENHELRLASGLPVGKQPAVAEVEKFSGQSVALGKSWCSQQPVGFVPSFLSETPERNWSFPIG